MVTPSVKILRNGEKEKKRRMHKGRRFFCEASWLYNSFSFAFRFLLYFPVHFSPLPVACLRLSWRWRSHCGEPLSAFPISNPRPGQPSRLTLLASPALVFPTHEAAAAPQQQYHLNTRTARGRNAGRPHRFTFFFFFFFIHAALFCTLSYPWDSHPAFLALPKTSSLSARHRGDVCWVLRLGFTHSFSLSLSWAIVTEV